MLSVTEDTGLLLSGGEDGLIHVWSLASLLDPTKQSNGKYFLHVSEGNFLSKFFYVQDKFPWMLFILFLIMHYL